MSKYTKQLVVLTLVLSLLAPSAFIISAPQKVHAQGSSTASAAGGILSCLGSGLIDLGIGASVVGLVVPTNDASVTKNTGAVTNKECILDGLVVLIREVLISSITRSIVNWINNGFEGGPSFVTDLDSFLLDVGDQVAGSFIEGSKLAFLCSPFQLDVRIALALDYYSSFQDKISCTLTGAIENIENAFDDVTDQNSWKNWFQLSVNPANTAIGAFTEAQAGLYIAINTAQGKKLTILDWGDGFRPFEVCDTVGNDGILYDTDGVQTGLSPGTKYNCRTATPGTVINNQLDDVLGSGFRQLELADEFDEIIGAALSQLLKQVLGGGGGLFGLSSRSYDRPDYLSQLVSSSEQNAKEGFRDFGIASTEGGISLEQQFISAKKVSLQRLETSESLLNSLSGCYTDKLSSTTLSPADRIIAQERAQSATSTIASNVTPLKTLVTSEIEQAENTITRLLEIKEDLLEASSKFSVDRIIETEINPLIESGTVHDQDDLFIAQQQRQDIQDIMDSLNTQTNQKLTECNAFPQGTGDTSS